MVAVSRSINGISINGDEWLLEDDEKLKLFSHKDEAVEFLKNHGITDTDIESYTFISAIE